MNQTPDDINIEPIEGELGRCYVSSRSRPGVKHLVDIAEHDGHGACTCEYHKFRVLPMIMKGEKRGEKTMCWHVRSAKLEFCNQFLDKLREAEAKEASFMGGTRETWESDFP